MTGPNSVNSRFSADQVEHITGNSPADSSADKAINQVTKALAESHLAQQGNNSSVVYVLAYSGVMSLNQLRRENPPDPTLCTGHVGYSFDGKTIYGYHPRIPAGMSPEEAIRSMMIVNRNKGVEPATYLGELHDDTAIFHSVANNPKPEGCSPGLEQHVYVKKYEVSKKEFKEIQERHCEELSSPSRSYGFPGSHPNAENCATFPSVLGIPIPEQTGVMRQYLQSFKEKGEKWSPPAH